MYNHEVTIISMPDGSVGILQAPVVETTDSATHWINHYSEDKYQEINCAINWIDNDPVDSGICP